MTKKKIVRSLSYIAIFTFAASFVYVGARANGPFVFSADTSEGLNEAANGDPSGLENAAESSGNEGLKEAAGGDPNGLEHASETSGK